MKELAIAIRNYTSENYIEIIDSIKNAGFKNVFIEWYNDDIYLQQKVLEYVKRLGLNIIFAHLGYQNPNILWENNELGDTELNRYINDIKVCKSNGINLVIIHPTTGFEDFKIKEVGLNRIRKIIEFAEDNDIKVAFENVELDGYLDYLINNIDSKNIGICYDVGHCHLFYDSKFDSNLFKNKVFAIHLHDNFKKMDEHNLPFDGTVDWEHHIKRIINMNYNGYISIECGYKEKYNVTIENFYKIAYDRGSKIIELFELYNNK